MPAASEVSSQAHPSPPLTSTPTWDVIIVGSGFGGSVMALRLVEKGYRVLMLEKGRRLRAPDFPKTNWDVKRWLWWPLMGFRGLFKMTFLRHVTVLSGVGVGGGSLVYANTLPIPTDGFFNAPSWSCLADWKSELLPHYETARRMLGAVQYDRHTYADGVLREVARDIGRESEHHATHVAVYLGEPGKTVPDPYFNGRGPTRTGCTHCGGCMLGCRYNAKNTLDKNYLHLAEAGGLRIEPDCEVTWVRVGDAQADADVGYVLDVMQGPSVWPWRRRKVQLKAKQVIFSGGVLGTVPLLLKLQQSQQGLPKLSHRLGDFVRTNSESLIGVVTPDAKVDMTEGVAISSILHTDEHSHLEPVRYPKGSGALRLLGGPHVGPGSLLARLGRLFGTLLLKPLRWLRVFTVRDWAKQTLILLYMRTLEGHLSLRRRRRWLLGGRLGTGSRLASGPRPAAAIAEATDLASRVAQKTGGEAMSLVTETILNVPTTAHILGGCAMGQTAANGVIDAKHRVFGYPGLYVVDGSAISANPGVNPSLTICALAERAATFWPTVGPAAPATEA